MKYSGFFNSQNLRAAAVATSDCDWCITTALGENCFFLLRVLCVPLFHVFCVPMFRFSKCRMCGMQKAALFIGIKRDPF